MGLGEGKGKGWSVHVDLLLSRSRSLQALGLLAGTKPSKVAARLSLADWLLVVLLGTGTSVSSSTDAITAAATVALVRAFICHRRHGSAADTLSRTGRQFVDGYFYVISRVQTDGPDLAYDKPGPSVCVWRSVLTLRMMVYVWSQPCA